MSPWRARLVPPGDTDSSARNASDELDVCGLLVHVDPHRAALVVQRLMAFPGLDVLSRTPDGLLVVTVRRVRGEATKGGSMAQTLAGIDATAGVIRSTLVYRYSDPDVSP